MHDDDQEVAGRLLRSLTSVGRQSVGKDVDKQQSDC